MKYNLSLPDDLARVLETLAYEETMANLESGQRTTGLDLIRRAVEGQYPNGTKVVAHKADGKWAFSYTGVVFDPYDTDPIRREDGTLK